MKEGRTAIVSPCGEGGSGIMRRMGVAMRLWRERRGLTQRDAVAEIDFGLSQQTWSRYEAGLASPPWPSDAVAERLAETVADDPRAYEALTLAMSAERIIRAIDGEPWIGGHLRIAAGVWLADALRRAVDSADLRAAVELAVARTAMGLAAAREEEEQHGPRRRRRLTRVFRPLAEVTRGISLTEPSPIEGLSADQTAVGLLGEIFDWVWPRAAELARQDMSILLGPEETEARVHAIALTKLAHVADLADILIAGGAVLRLTLVPGVNGRDKVVTISG